MKIFNLPDLGEGLTEAEIHEWLIKEGDEVKTDQPMLTVETAKAVVEVPAPRSGIIAKLHGQAGDIIDVGAPLVEFTVDDENAAATTDANKSDSGTVVGNVQHTQGGVWQDATSQTNHATSQAQQMIKALPAVRQLAKQLQVDLTRIQATGPNGQISKADVEKAAKSNSQSALNIEGLEPLRGVRRIMAQAMTQSHQEVAAVTLCDDADINSWPSKTDITYRCIRALLHACHQEPALNAWYDSQQNARKLFSQVHLGLALDSPDGLFVPVIKDCQELSAQSVRETINRFKQQVADRTIAQDELSGATISLSNFGTFAGRYANPVVVPPMVAILGIGRLRQQATMINNEINMHRTMPLSLTFDHRAVTGGEASRFLAAVIADLSAEK